MKTASPPATQKALIMHYASYQPPGRISVAGNPPSLRCRKMKKGIYRFRRRDGRRINLVSAQVQIASPWCNQTVRGFLAFCSIHECFPESCPDDGRDCVIVDRPTKIQKWSAYVHTNAGRDRRAIDVCLLRRMPSRKKLKKDPLRPAFGAGFAFMLLTNT